MVLAVVALHAGCGGLCRETALAFQEETRRQVSWVGPGETTLAGGEYHVGITYSAAMLDRLAHEASQGFEYRQRRVSVDTRDVGRRTAVRMQVRPVLRGLTLSDAATGAITLAFEVDALVAIRAPGRTSETLVPGEFLVSGHLEMEVDSGTGSQLVLVLDRLGGPSNSKGDEISIEGAELRLGLQALDPAVAEAVAEFVGPTVEDTLLREIRRLVLVRFPPLEVAGEEVALRPTGLEMRTKRGLLFVGFASSLRPAAGGGPSLDEAVEEGGMTLSVHPGLLTAGARLALGNEKLPHRYEAPGEAAESGSLHVTIDELSLLSDSFLLRFRGWEQATGVCGVDEWTVSGPMALRPGGVVLVPTRASPSNALGDSELESSELYVEADAMAWLQSPLTAGLVELTERLLMTDAVILGTGERLRVEATKLESTRWSIDVSLTPLGDGSAGPDAFSL